LSASSAFGAAWWKLSARVRHLRALDPLPRHHRLLSAGLRAIGIGVSEARFFAGHLKDPSGESVFRSARRESGQLSFRAASRLVARVGALDSFNRRMGRETVRLHLTKRVWPALEACVRHLHVTRALEGQRAFRILLHRPATFDAAVLDDAVSGAEIRFCGGGLAWVRALGSTLQGLWWWVRARIARWFAPFSAAPAGSDPAVLLLQDDELGTDRSVRAMPHWLDPAGDAPAFRTLVWLTQPHAVSDATAQALKAIRIEALDRERVNALASRARSPASSDLSQWAFGLLRAALAVHDSPRSLALAAIGKLALRASCLSAVCDAAGVRALVAGEPYLADADAMLIAGSASALPTITYQYSNISFISPAMMTTADRLLLFAPQYARNWTYDGIGPQAVNAIGYPFDAAFRRVRGRAAAHRRRLEAAGARFVLCYFDENVTDGKYGQISPADHRTEVTTLAQWVLDDPTLGLVVKSQFARNSPMRRYAGNPTLIAAAATGRYVELCEGAHRNILFPAEAALPADLAIGHTVGATAALEAALAGRRCVLLNPHEWRGTWDHLYRSADLVYESLDGLRAAVADYRTGRGHAALGDWSGILAPFDPFRDGRAAARLREEVELLAGVRQSQVESPAFEPRTAGAATR
jgi:hypothetical protein